MKFKIGENYLWVCNKPLHYTMAKFAEEYNYTIWRCNRFIPASGNYKEYFEFNLTNNSHSRQMANPDYDQFLIPLTKLTKLFYEN